MKRVLIPNVTSNVCPRLRFGPLVMTTCLTLNSQPTVSTECLLMLFLFYFKQLCKIQLHLNIN